MRLGALFKSRAVLPTILLAMLFACPPAAMAQAPAEKVDLEKQLLRRSTPNASTATRPTTQKAAGARASSSGLDAGRVAIALGVVLGLILAMRWGARRFFGVAGAGRSTRAVQVLSRSPLSPRQQLVLLRIGKRLLVVADGGGQMNTLSEITDPDEVAALLGQLQDDHSARATKSFGSLFGKMRGSYESDTESEETPIRDSQDTEDDPAVASTRQELSGLMDKVRLLSRQFKS